MITLPLVEYSEDEFPIHSYHWKLTIGLWLFPCWYSHMQSLKLFPALINVPQLKFESKLMLQAHSKLVEKRKKEGAVTNLLG